MTSKARFTCFVVRFLPLLVMLAWPFAAVGSGYRSIVCGAANRFVLSSPQTGHVGRLLPDLRPGLEWHAIAAVFDRSTRSVEAQFDIDIHQIFCLPTAVFSALILAGYWTWGGKHMATKLLGGVALFQLRGALQFVRLERIVVDPALAGTLDVLLVVVNRSLVAPLGMAFAQPLLLWLGLFRRPVVESTPGDQSPSSNRRART